MSEEQADKTAAPAKKSGRGKLILVAGAAVLLLAGGGAAAFFMGIIPTGSAAVAGQESQAELTHEDIVFVDLPELLVNLNVTGKRLHFLKLATALEVSGEDQAAVVRQFVPRILDSFHMYLRAITPEGLQGSEGVFRLKEELLVLTNEAVRPAQVRDVLVREMLVQ
jgi:flagellar FliL protein